MIKINGKKLEKEFIFPAGEVQVRISEDVLESDIVIVDAHIKNSDDIMKLLLVTDVIHNSTTSCCSKRLNIHYLPYARQDRECYTGEANSKAVILGLIHDLNYDHVTIADIHSNQDYDSLMIDAEITQLEIFQDNPHLLKGVTALVSPDKGATEKTKKIAEEFNLPIIQINKVRETDTGKLTDLTIESGEEYIQGGTLMVVDDICDGGGTFNWIANKFFAKGFNVESLQLYVTHGIFSQGLDGLLDDYDKIITTDSFYEGESNSNIEVIKL